MLLPILAAATTFVLASHAIPHEGDTLPATSVYHGYSCTGANMSPNLEWSGAPKATKSFALTLFDPDAPVSGGWWHWIVFDIPAGWSGLKENAGAASGKLTAGAMIQGMTSFGSPAYGGPCPPPGPAHHYVFTLYALDVAKVDGAGASTTGPDLLKLIEKHTLAKTTLTGRYGVRARSDAKIRSYSEVKFMNRTLFSAALAALAVVVSSAIPALSAPSHEQNMAYVAALYRDVLQRSPGYDGLAAWVPGLDSSSKSRVDVAREFIKSDEYRRLRVRDMFSAYLHRGMTDADLANFVRNGGSLRSLRVSLLASQEYFSLHGSNARGWLNGLFRDMLGRSPGYGGVDTWVQQINQGKNRTEIVNEIYGSPEALGRIVDSLYGAFLKRAADPSGKAQNVQAMQRGTTEEDIAVGLLTTAEYYNRNQTGNGIVGPPFGFGGGNNPGNYGLQQGDAAQFVNQNVPNGMIAGQTYYVSVTLRNTGRTQWDPNSYALNVYPDGTPTWSTIAIPMPAPVNPGNAVTFTFNVIAPQSPGTYDFRWQLRRAGFGFFGDVTQDLSVTVSAGRTY